MKSFSRYVETVIIFGTYGRRDISTRSLHSLLTSVHDQDVIVVVSDATSFEEFDNGLYELRPDEYIWTPGNVGMATSRNIALELAREKYVFDWVCFVEDDLLYNQYWYTDLLDTATKLYGKKSPLGLAYSSFSAAPYAVGNDDTVLYDSDHDVYSSLFGLRADQRLYKMSHYVNVERYWESDLFGISSAQTGKVTHRNLMRGFCGGSIGHRNLISEVPGQESTWDGSRDIGPAAFDKRLGGYDGLINYASSLFVSEYHNTADRQRSKSEGRQKLPEASPPALKPTVNIPMTLQKTSERLTPLMLMRRIKKSLKILLTGKG